MTSKTSILNEVLRLGLSPAVLTGKPSKIIGGLTKHLARTYHDDEYAILDTLKAPEVKELLSLIRLRGKGLKFIVIDARGVTDASWQKLLKTLEDTHPETQLIFVSDGKVPKTIESRSFRCHIPSTEAAASFGGAESFAVGSWLLGVDSKNREQVLKSCQSWTPMHTELLIMELESRLAGHSVLSIELKRFTNNKLMAALMILNKYNEAPTAPIYAGLRLIS